MNRLHPDDQLGDALLRCLARALAVDILAEEFCLGPVWPPRPPHFYNLDGEPELLGWFLGALHGLEAQLYAILERPTG